MKQLMKTPKIIAALTIGLLASCSSDDSNDNTPATASIIGEWELTSITSNGEELVENPDCLDRVIFSESTYDYSEYFDFEDGNGCTLVSGEATPEAYVLSGTTLSVTDEGEALLYEILELSETTMKLKDVYTDGGETFTDIETYNRL